MLQNIEYLGIRQLMNLKVRISDRMAVQINKLAPGSKSEFVRQAIQEKIQREITRKREDQWIEALSNASEQRTEAQAWFWDDL